MIISKKDTDKVGPCLKHGEVHSITVKDGCWRVITEFLRTRGMNGTQNWKEYMEAYNRTRK